MKALRRIVAACLCVVPALAMADATRGGVEASSLTVVRTNSFGLAEDLQPGFGGCRGSGYRVPLGEPESTFLLPYGQEPPTSGADETEPYFPRQAKVAEQQDVGRP